jgi:hypothetical protein
VSVDDQPDPRRRIEADHPETNRGVVPMLMSLGISPELTQGAYRIGDSFTNIITPLMPYMPLIIAFVILAVFTFFIGRQNRDLLRVKAYRDFFLRLIPPLSTGVFIAAYTVADGLGVRRAGTVTGYVAWLFLLHGLPIPLYTLATRRRRLAARVRGRLGVGVAAGEPRDHARRQLPVGRTAPRVDLDPVAPT